MAKPKLLRVVCPRCGKQYPKGKWCECGFQDEACFSNFDEYLESLTFEDLKKLRDLYGIRLQAWQSNTKSKIISYLRKNNDLREKLGYENIILPENERCLVAARSRLSDARRSASKERLKIAAKPEPKTEMTVKSGELEEAKKTVTQQIPSKPAPQLEEIAPKDEAMAKPTPALKPNTEHSKHSSKSDTDILIIKWGSRPRSVNTSEFLQARMNFFAPLIETYIEEDLPRIVIRNAKAILEIVRSIDQDHTRDDAARVIAEKFINASPIVKDRVAEELVERIRDGSLGDFLEDLTQ
jgi:hypothetical protein